MNDESKGRGYLGARWGSKAARRRVEYLDSVTFKATIEVDVVPEGTDEDLLTTLVAEWHGDSPAEALNRATRRIHETIDQMNGKFRDD